MAATDEIAASISAAEEHIIDARNASSRGRYHDCAYHSASAAETAGNALILALGARIPRIRHNAEVIEYAATRLKPGWLRDESFTEMLASLKDLQAHVVKSRYPIKLREGVFLPPSRYYTHDMTTGLLEEAVLIVDTVKHFIGLLGCSHSP